MEKYEIDKYNQKQEFPDKSQLSYAIDLAQYTVYKRYLSELDKYPVVEPSPALLAENSKTHARFYELNKLVFRKGEDVLQKLSTVYHASMSLGCSLIVMVDVPQQGAQADIYIGLRDRDGNHKKHLSTSYETLGQEILSNFPGTELQKVDAREKMPKIIDDVFQEDSSHIAAVSGIASIRDKSKTQNKDFIQGIERFIDAMQGKVYTALFIAEPISKDEQMMIRSGYEQLYTELSPFRKSTLSYSQNSSYAVMKSLTKGVSYSVTDGTSFTQAHTIGGGVNLGLDFGKSAGISEGTTTTTGKNSPTKVARVGNALGAVGDNLAMLGSGLGAVNPILPIIGAISGTVFKGVGTAMQGNSVSESFANSVTESIGKTMGLNLGASGNFSKTDTTGQNHSETQSQNEAKTNSTTDTRGEGHSMQLEIINKYIEDMLTRIDEQLQRVQEGEDFGAYSCGAYFISGKADICQLAANTYRALMLGEGSSVETNAIHAWDDKGTVQSMKEYLKRFVHPHFSITVQNPADGSLRPMIYTPGTIVSGLELPLHLGLPTKSVYGLPVVEHAEFGRNVVLKHSENHVRELEVGNIYHMGQEENARVSFDVDHLSAHTFITGSTGSGKSNTICQMLKTLTEQKVKFLVIEPAKGEYAKNLASQMDVTVYGTNPKQSGAEMLSINPFSFPEHIHVLEHLDRVVEIFNACWPMYAAMPAVLKDAVQRSYEKCGWDLVLSEHPCNPPIFPDFEMVYSQVRQVMEESDYSEENKGNYIGSLVTRLQSLTKGIDKLIFTSSGLSDEELFENNVIVDLSRTGSATDKSLIMGFLVLKLQEHRMKQEHEPNSELCHVTVLEEAHHLLRKTSDAQLDESNNLQGKAVEMLSNAIAEMRTYGEGFIIADQSPGLLDMSAIRNTNTKIIMRLPDYSDRSLVGKAAGLNDEQIEELSRLETGVAAIMQNEWLEAVLCKVEKFDRISISNRELTTKIQTKEIYGIEQIKRILLDNLIKSFSSDDCAKLQQIQQMVLSSELSSEIKCMYINASAPASGRLQENLQGLVYALLDGNAVMKYATQYTSVPDRVAERIKSKLRQTLAYYEAKDKMWLYACLVDEYVIRCHSHADLCKELKEIFNSNDERSIL